MNVVLAISHILATILSHNNSFERRRKKVVPHFFDVPVKLVLQLFYQRE